MKKITVKDSNVLLLLLGIFTVMSLSMNPAMVTDETVAAISQNPGRAASVLLKLICSVEIFEKEYQTAGILAVFFCFVLYRYSFRLGKTKTYERVLGILMALTLVFGRVFDTYRSSQILAAGIVQLVKTLICLAGGSLFFAQLVKAAAGYARENIPLFGGFDITSGKKYRRAVFLFILAAWSITYIAFFPGLFQGDTEDIIYMSYNYRTSLVDTVVQIDEDNMWVDHHSVLYTVLLGSFVKGARAVCGNENAGIAVYSTLQGVFTAWILAYSIYKMKGYGVPAFVRTCLAVFFAFFPWMPRYALMATKDTLFSDLLLLYILLVADMVTDTGDKVRRGVVVRLVLYSVLMFLIRKNGFYVSVLSIPFLVLTNKKWIRPVIIAVVCIAAAKFMYSNVLLPACHIPDGSMNAALAVPLQHTSRYLQYFPDDVSGSERQAIGRIVDYDRLAAHYDADDAGYARKCWHKEADGSDFAEYMKGAWLPMFLRHPLTYVAATADSTYGYFYPVVVKLSFFEDASLGSYQNINRDNYFDFHPAQNAVTKAAGGFLRVCDTFLERAPLVNILCTCAAYLWILVFLCTACIVKKDRQLLMLVIPLLVLMLTIITGPCNGNWQNRLTYPVAMSVAAAAAFVFRTPDNKTID